MSNTDDGMNETWSLHTMGYYSVTEREWSTNTGDSLGDLEIIIRRERSQKPKITFTWSHLHEMSRLVKTIKLVIVSGWKVDREGWQVTANGYSVSFSRDENAGKLVMVMVAQVWKCMKNHRIARFQQMDLMERELHLKAVKEPSTFAQPSW